LRRCHQPTPTKPVPSNNSEAGSGVGALLTGPIVRSKAQLAVTLTHTGFPFASTPLQVWNTPPVKSVKPSPSVPLSKTAFATLSPSERTSVYVPGSSESDIVISPQTAPPLSTVPAGGQPAKLAKLVSTSEVPKGLPIPSVRIVAPDPVPEKRPIKGSKPPARIVCPVALTPPPKPHV